MYCLSWRGAHSGAIDAAESRQQSQNNRLIIDGPLSNIRVQSRRLATSLESAGRPALALEQLSARPASRSSASAPREHSRSTIATLEGAALALGARSLTDEQLEIARLTNELIRRNVESACVPAAHDLARSFHHQLLGACPNLHMVGLLEAQTGDLSPVRRAPATLMQIARAADDHDELLAMVGAGTAPVAIERFARRHADASHVCFG